MQTTENNKNKNKKKKTKKAKKTKGEIKLGKRSIEDRLGAVSQQRRQWDGAEGFRGGEERKLQIYFQTARGSWWRSGRALRVVQITRE
jgi:hypothetical protein